MPRQRLERVPWEQATARHVRAGAAEFARAFTGEVGVHVRDKLQRYAGTYGGQLLVMRAVGELRRQGLPDEMVCDLLHLTSLPAADRVAAAFDRTR